MAKPDYTYSTAPDGPGGKSVPVRTDNRSLLQMLHEEIGNAIGLGPNRKPDDIRIGPQGTPLMDAVDAAVKGAPPPGTESN